MRLSALRTGLLYLAFAGMSSVAQGIAPSDNATPRDAAVGNTPDATQQQPLPGSSAEPMSQSSPGTSTEPMNLSADDADRLRALTECDNRPIDEQQACRDSVEEQYTPSGEGESSDSNSGAGK